METKVQFTDGKVNFFAAIWSVAKLLKELITSADDQSGAADFCTRPEESAPSWSSPRHFFKVKYEKDRANIGSARYLAQNIRGAALKVLEKTGHVVNEENPEALARTLDDFYRGTAADGGAP